MKCEVCGSKDIKRVLDLGSQPLCDDLIKIGSQEESKRYPIKISLCNSCKTAIQEYSVPKRTLFPHSYHYRAKVTPSVLTGMEELVDSLGAKFEVNIKDKKVLDVGCNDGSLLNIFKERGAKTFGIDPTDAILEAEGKHCYIKDFFSPKTAQLIKSRFGSPDIVTFTNCFAHIENLPELIASLSSLMNSNTIVVIENHYLVSVLERNQFDTFYHEHPRTYSMRSFEVIAKLLHAQLIGVERTSRYGGNIRAYIKRNASQSVKIKEDYDFNASFQKMNRFIPEWISSKKEEIKKIVAKSGSMTGIAFPGRASILVNLLELTTEELEATFEIKGSIKTGYYIPGTRIPILPESELFKRDILPDQVLNLAWHIIKDVEVNLSSNSYKPKIINIL